MNIKVHIGAHKTATTHFQDNLKNMKLHNQYDNIIYIHRNEIRKGKYVTRLMDEPRLYRSFKLRLGLTEPAPWTGTALGYDSNIDLCLISEENIMGKPKDILENFYTKSALRVSKFINDIQNSNVTIFMSIRRYDELFTSAYSQVLRAGKPVKDFDIYWQKFLKGNRGWHSVVQEISKMLPDIEFVIWRFEDYIKNPAYYLELFSEIDFEDYKDWIYPPSTRRLSESQIMAIKNMRLNLPGMTHIKKTKLENITKNEVTNKLFSPISEYDKEISMQKYFDDCDLISKISNVRYINM